MRTLVIDNGAHAIKLGWADSENCLHVQNAMMRSRDRRMWLGNAVDLCKDFTGLQYRRPIDRGQLFSWELEKAIWDWTWDTKEIVDSVDEFKESALLLTETPGSLSSSSTNTDQVVFEEYEFMRYRRTIPQVLAANSALARGQAQLVVDIGFGATHIVPVINHELALQSGTFRLAVGGKMLTNYLKEMISYRYYNMMEETAILGRIKENVCFTSLDFAGDLEKWNKSRNERQLSEFARAYALPSSHDEPLGRVLPSLEEAVNLQKGGSEQVLILENERFSVPEALYDPMGHVGLEQAGIPELVARSIAAAPADYQPLLWSNIVLCGGSANLPNTKERLEIELRKWAPADIPLRILTSLGGKNEEAAWFGGKALVENGLTDLETGMITKEEYFEQGPAHVAKKFAFYNRWKPQD